MNNRFRYTDDRRRASVVQTDYNPDGSIAFQIQRDNVNSYADGSYRSVLDTVDPGFFSRSKRGEITMHPVTFAREQRTSVASNWSFGTHPVWGRRTIVGDVSHLLYGSWAPPSWYINDVTNAVDATLIGCFAKAKSPDVQAMVTAAEAGKTVDSIMNPLERALELSGRVLSRKGRLISRGLTGAAAAASAWLEYRYGWKPLMADIAGTAQSLRNSGFKQPTRLTTRDGTTLKWSSSGTGNPSIASVSVATSYSRYIENKISSGLIYELSDASYAEYLKRSLGLSLGDVPSTVWELVPFSFVADWFVGIGPWLQALKPLPSFRVLGNWTTNHETIKGSLNVLSASQFVANPPSTTYQASGGSYSETIETTDRLVNRELPSMPATSVSFRSLTHSIDAASLLLTRLTGNFQRLRF